MENLWLGKLSLRDQGISGNLWVWTGVRSHAADTSFEVFAIVGSF